MCVLCVAVAADKATRPADITARDITLGRANFLASAKYSAIATGGTGGLACSNPVQWAKSGFQATMMSKYLLVLLLIASPAVAQVKLTPKTSAAHPDPCAPIGRTADGKLVYSMKCENLPVPPPSPQAELREGAAARRRAGARDAAEWRFRLVLRPQVTGRAPCAKPDGVLFA
ncbi:hypothetical protein ACVWZK_003862 [Bradyrhizobium sp. GM0.4]